MIDQSPPPQALDAEKSLIGSVLVYPSSIDEVVDLVRVDDFFAERHQIIWRVLVAMRDNGDPIEDVTVIAGELRRRKVMEESGGAAYLNELMGAVGTGAHADYYAAAVRDAADKRRLLAACHDGAKLAHDPSMTTEDAVGAVSGSLDAILERQAGDTASMLEEALVDVLEGLSKDDSQTIPTGWHGLDAVLSGGLWPGQLIVLAARPSVGKTAAAVSAALNMASNDARVLLVSLEMSRPEVTTRCLSSISGIPFHLIRSKKLNEGQTADLYGAADDMQSMRIGIDDKAGRTVPQISALARKWKRKHGLDVLIVDYLQIVTPEDARMQPAQAVAQMSRKLKCLAKDLGVPVIALAQLNRAIEQRENKRPRLSDLKESGAIEQDADVVIFIDRKATYDQSGNPTDATFIVAKHRNGPTRDVPLFYHPSTMTFKNPRD